MSDYAPQTSDSPESPRRHAQVVPTRAQLAARREFRRALRRARNPLYIPFAWLLLTLTVMLLALAGIVALVASLRGEAAPALEPRIAIVTADIVRVASAITPATTPAVDDSDYAPQVILAPDTPASIILTGPAVPTVIITNTPVPLAVGLQAIVSNVGNDELNVRNLPSVRGSEVLFSRACGYAIQHHWRTAAG